MEVIHQHIVPENSDKHRLSDYGAIAFKGIYSKSAFKKMMKRGEVILNGIEGQTGDWVGEGDRLEIIGPTIHLEKTISLDIEVVYEDEDMAVINKPAGIPVSGNQYRTIQNALVNLLTRSSKEGALSIPRPAHRLDALTSGLLLIGKTSPALLVLNNYFEQKEIQKTYVALVVGKIDDEGIIEQEIDNKWAKTRYKRLNLIPSLKTDQLSLVELYPETGRTHQLRKHLAGIDHPILGDALYGADKPLLKGKGLFLTATQLEFSHPVTREKVYLKLALPPKFKRRMIYEKQRWDKFN